MGSLAGLHTPLHGNFQAENFPSHPKQKPGYATVIHVLLYITVPVLLSLLVVRSALPAEDIRRRFRGGPEEVQRRSRKDPEDVQKSPEVVQRRSRGGPEEV